MTVSAKGEYALEGRTRASGRYDLTFVWTGRLESDGEDFLLLHGRTRLERWEAQETMEGPDGIRLLTTGDFDEFPELKVNYFIKLGELLHLDFIIRGFPVPRSVPEDAFYLHLPASAENDERETGLNYDTYIVRGSNVVALDDAAFAKNGVEKSFQWAWRRQTGVQKIDRSVFEMNRHEAKVTIVISPPKTFP